MLPLGISTQGAIPGLQLAEVMEVALHFMFAMLRIGSFVIAAPLFGARYVILPVRVVMAVSLTIPVMMTVEMPPIDVLATFAAVPLVISEISIGVSGGLLLAILFGAATTAGDRIASTAGLGFAAQIDPSSGAQAPVVSQFFSLFLLSVFVAVDGHLIAISIIIDSYHLLPPGGGIKTEAIKAAAEAAAAEFFVLSVQMMMPAVSVLLLVNVLIGVITRSAPQMNIFSFGFPMTLSITVILLYLGAPAMGGAFEHVIDTALMILRTMTQGVADG